MFSTHRFVMLAALAVFYSVSSAHAVVNPITATDLSPAVDQSPEPDPTAVTGFVSGGATYGELDLATATAVSVGGTAFSAQSSPVPVSGLSALNDPFLTSGRTNVALVDYDLGRVVGLNEILFLYEINTAGQAADAVTVIPLIDGVVVGTWELDLASSDYGVQTAIFDVNNALPNIGARGVTFSLADFTGDTGVLSGVNGLRFVDRIGADDWDPSLVGIARAVPEPATAMLAGLAAMALTARRRRKLS